MRRSSLWQWSGFALTTLGGTVLHFLYDWTGGSVLAAPFSGVNESTWEHMKLLFWPLFFFALIQRRFWREQQNFWCVKLAGILLVLLLIPVLYYTGNGAFGKTPDWVNISIFYIAAAAVFLFEWRAFARDPLLCSHSGTAFAAVCMIGVLFVVFTFAPPRLPLFQIPGSFKNLM